MYNFPVENGTLERSLDSYISDYTDISFQNRFINIVYQCIQIQYNIHEQYPTRRLSYYSPIS